MPEILTDADVQKIKDADWGPYHDSLCPIAIGDGDSCGCIVSYLMRAIATIDALKDGTSFVKYPTACPWCKTQLYIHHSGVACDKCCRYFEQGKWLAVGCDENHAHGKACLYEIEPPKSVSL